jgi:hypothetical protein
VTFGAIKSSSTFQGLRWRPSFEITSADVKGPHIPLVASVQAAGGMPSFRYRSSSRLVYPMGPGPSAEAGLRHERLFFCSIPLNTQYMPVSMPGGGSDGAQHSYATMALQDLQIGPLENPRVSFFQFAVTKKDSSPTDVDGMLPTGLFRRLFICHAHLCCS